MQPTTDYSKCRIINIRRNPRTTNLHAALVDADGVLIIAATLDYIIQALEERLPKGA
jgi:hypothetical protein